MTKSYQNEIPRARVNITLDLETGGAAKKHELPLKLLVMGDYSNGRATERLADRTRLSINKENIEQVLGDLKPRVQYSVENRLRNDGTEFPVDLVFDSFKSFHPEQVGRSIPAINNMLAMRNLLKDLKSNLLDNTKFRREMERILQSRPELSALLDELRHHAPLDKGAAGVGETDGDAGPED